MTSVHHTEVHILGPNIFSLSTKHTQYSVVKSPLQLETGSFQKKYKNISEP